MKKNLCIKRINGVRCKNKAISDSDYCIDHDGGSPILNDFSSDKEIEVEDVQREYTPGAENFDANNLEGGGGAMDSGGF